MYGALTYRGDLSHLADPLEVPREDGGQTRTVPHLLGADPFGRPYEVLDVEVRYVSDLEDDDHPAGLGPDDVVTVVHLGPASIEATRGNRARVLHNARAEAEAMAQRARVAAFWRPDLYSTVAQAIADAAADAA